MSGRGGSHIDLEQLDELLFRAPKAHLWVPVGGRGVFGGQILGQALHAATRTVPGTIPPPARTWACHSMHAYFLQPGQPSVDVIYRIRRTSERRSFVTRTVEAIQHGSVIFQCQISFAKCERSQLDHQDPPMPEVPPPHQCPSLVDVLSDLSSRLPSKGLRDKVLESHADLPVDFRLIDAVPDLLDPNPPKLPPRRRVWMRVTKVQAEGLDECCAAYFSDHLLLVTALLPHGLHFPSPKLGAVASLDHGLWFHSPFRADDWILYDVHSPRLSSHRGLAIGHMYSAKTKQLCVTSVQEGLLRLARPSMARSLLQGWLLLRSYWKRTLWNTT